MCLSRSKRVFGEIVFNILIKFWEKSLRGCGCANLSTCYYFVFYFLGQRPAAIVSPLAGTTRDVVETALNLGGYPLLLSDTAGLRDSQELIEKEGVKRALQR